MAEKKMLTMSLMDSPYESETTTTALRIAEAALSRGVSVNVFGYEGAVTLPIKGQTPHPNPVKGTTAEQQDHPTTAKLIAALFEKAGGDVTFDWISCGLCVDERGATDWIDGVRRGGPGDFFKWTQESTNTLVMGTR